MIHYKTLCHLKIKQLFYSCDGKTSTFRKETQRRSQNASRLLGVVITHLDLSKESSLKHNWMTLIELVITSWFFFGNSSVIVFNYLRQFLPSYTQSLWVSSPCHKGEERSLGLNFFLPTRLRTTSQLLGGERPIS